MQNTSIINRDHLEGFYAIFLDIKRYINNCVFEEDTNTVYSKKPFVNIRDIARKVGITKIIEVRGELIDGRHAVLVGTVILLKKTDSREEKLFSIAHEIFHFIFLKKENKDLMPAVVEKKEIWEKKTGEIETGKTERLGKGVWRRRSREGMVARTNSKVEDEIADYFAANLLIPIERFILWEDKTDEEIARAFKVVEKCIQKRREEIPYELDLLSPEDISLYFDSEDEAVLSHDTLNHTPEGQNLHDTKFG